MGAFVIKYLEHGVHKAKQKASDTPGLELQMVLSSNVDAGSQT